MGPSKDFGKTISYEESKKIQMKLQLLASEQFIHVYERYQKWFKKQGENNDVCDIMWGDQIEGHRMEVNQQTGKLELCLKPLPEVSSFLLTIQYGKWMFEMVPIDPFEGKSCDFEKIVLSLRQRYRQLYKQQEIFMTIPSIPFLGVLSEEQAKLTQSMNTVSKSRFINDCVVTDHICFKTYTQNMREKKGKLGDIRVPIFKDKNTDLETSSYLEPYPGYIFMDTIGFGMGLSCLQCTFSTKDVRHAQYLHDSLNIISPLMLALTAATPIIKGKLSDWDVRWNIISAAVDDRKDNQKNPEDSQYQPKSRYSNLNHYISNRDMNLPQYSDLPINENKQVLQHMKAMIKDKGIQMDDALIRHIAILCSRQFLIVHQKFIEMTSQEDDLFQMMNSTNWNSIRFKIPNNECNAWRVELRTMQVQITPDENSAYNILSFIMVMLMHYANLNFYLPLSLVDENFNRAHKRDAITKQKFYFRTNIKDMQKAIVKEMTLDQIFFGSTDKQFIGLLPTFINFYQDPTLCQQKKQYLTSTYTILKQLWNFLKMKMTGKILTLAQWMRKFVSQHKQYKFDSIVNQIIWTDMIFTLDKLAKGQIQDSTLIVKIFDI